MKKIIKWFLIGLLFLLVALALIYHKTVYYGYVQARGQLGIVFHTQPVDKILNDPDFPDSLKNKIRIINDVKNFADHYLGLNTDKNYTTYYQQKTENLMWVLSACKPYRLEAYEWKFPILGSFTYKGFFLKSMAEKEENKLRKEGYDTSIRTAGGWSTLGILKDPILSDMLDEDEAGLANLIIHELTHATIFLHDSLSFNENLATFIGAYGTLEYMKFKHGENSVEYRNYLTQLSDRNKYNRYILHSCHLLDSLYNSFNPSQNDNEKEDSKKQMIGEIVNNLDTVSFSAAYKIGGFFTDGLPNNTYFMSFMRYRAFQQIFTNELEDKFNGNIKNYIEFLKKKYNR